MVESGAPFSAVMRVSAWLSEAMNMPCCVRGFLYREVQLTAVLRSAVLRTAVLSTAVLSKAVLSKAVLNTAKRQNDGQSGCAVRRTAVWHTAVRRTAVCVPLFALPQLVVSPPLALH